MKMALSLVTISSVRGTVLWSVAAKRIAALALSMVGVFGVTSAMAAVEIQSWQTQQGAKVMFVESNALPMVDIQVTVDAGSARDGEHWGLASLTADLLGTATELKDENALADAFNAIGAQFSVSASRDSAAISLRTLTRPVIQRQAVEVFLEVLAKPKFDGAIFERERQRLLTGLKQKSVKPQAIATDLIWENLYQNHPYGHPVEGNEETLPKITVGQLQAFYRDHYTANNAVIAIVGKMSQQEAQTLAQEISDALPVFKHTPPPIAAPNPLSAKQSLIQEFDATQTTYHLVQQGVQRGHPDYVPLFVGNHLFGGSGFGSYLMEEVREKRGLVYSVYSYFAPMKAPGPFVIGLSTKNASATQAQEVVETTLANFLRDFDEERFQATKDNLLGGWPLRFDSNAKILGYLSMIGFYELPLDYLEWFPQQVQSVTKEQVLQAWRKHIQPEKMLTIMVGKPQ